LQGRLISRLIKQFQLVKYQISHKEKNVTINAHLSQMNETPVELWASSNPPQNTKFGFWAYGECKPLAEIEAGGEVGACYKVTVKKQNIQADFPVCLNLDYTMKMVFLPPGKNLKIRLVFTEEEVKEDSLQGYGEVLEVNPE